METVNFVIQNAIFCFFKKKNKPQISALINSSFVTLLKS